VSNQGESWLEKKGVAYERVFERVGPESENGCPELRTCMKAKWAEARRKEFLRRPRNGSTGPSHLIFEEVRRVSGHLEYGTISSLSPGDVLTLTRTWILIQSFSARMSTI
jgi:hypothetical protein